MLAESSQPVHCSGQGELGAAQALDEVTAPDSTRLLHRAQHRIQARESPWPSLARDRLASQDAVALEEDARGRMEALGWVRA